MLGARRIPFSGAGMRAEDGTDNVFHIQLKACLTTNKYGLRREALEKLLRHAYMNAELPLFAIYYAARQTFLLIYPVAEGDVAGAQKLVKFTWIHLDNPPQYVFVEGMQPSLWKVKVVPFYAVPKEKDAIAEEARKALLRGG